MEYGTNDSATKASEHAGATEATPAGVVGFMPSEWLGYTGLNGWSMRMDFILISYAIVDGFCIVYTLAILFNLSDSVASEHEVKELRGLLFVYLAFLSSDMVGGLVNGGISATYPLLGAIASGIAVITASLGCFLWYRFVEDRLRPFHVVSKAYRIATCVPIAFVCTFEAASIFTGWLFYIDAGGYYRTTDLFNYLPGVINYLYLSVPTVIALAFARREASAPKRTEYLSYASSMLVALAVGLTEDTFPDIPILSLCVFMVYNVLFLRLFVRRIDVDALTGLHSRESLGRYLAKAMTETSGKRSLGLCVVSVKGMGAYNDRYGHLAGDEALVALAHAVDAASVDLDAFAARDGGDEFCLVVNVARHTRNEVEAEVRTRLEGARGDARGGRELPSCDIACSGYPASAPDAEDLAHPSGSKVLRSQPIL